MDQSWEVANKRRQALIRKKLRGGGLTANEDVELEALQQQLEARQHDRVPLHTAAVDEALRKTREDRRG
ncbi:MAG: hypothetical protein AAF628_01360 [Planctomycetota bacterium]